VQRAGTVDAVALSAACPSQPQPLARHRSLRVKSANAPFSCHASDNGHPFGCISLIRADNSEKPSSRHAAYWSRLPMTALARTGGRAPVTIDAIRHEHFGGRSRTLLLCQRASGHRDCPPYVRNHRDAVLSQLIERSRKGNPQRYRARNWSCSYRIERDLSRYDPPLFASQIGTIVRELLQGAARPLIIQQRDLLNQLGAALKSGRL